MTVCYECPDCGGAMYMVLKLSEPPISEGRCAECGAVYRRRPRKPDLMLPLPRDYVKVGQAPKPGTIIPVRR